MPVKSKLKVVFWVFTSCSDRYHLLPQLRQRFIKELMRMIRAMRMLMVPVIRVIR